MKKFFENNWPLIALFLLSFLITWPVFVKGYFSHHDDLQVMRIFEMRKCFSDLQLPCRWSPDMAYGNGAPLFNFYGPLAYYVGALASYVIGYIGAAKLLFYLPLLFGGVSMYLLGKELFGQIPGFVAGVFYMFAPYRALDAYVRGAVGESVALSLIPIVFYFYLKLIKTQNKKYFLLASISAATFFMSHNIMVLLFTPILILWTLLLLYTNKINFKLPLFSLVIAFLLASFFLIPAFFEKGMLQTEGLTRGELNYRAQFVKVSQIFFDRSWNYGASSPLNSNTISYQVGWPHWWMVAFAFLFLVLKKDKENLLPTVYYILLFWLSVFMMHNKSAFIWERINLLTFVQFPWRFLSIAIFASSILAGYFVFNLPKKLSFMLTIAFTFLAILLNWHYFKPEYFYKDVDDVSKLTGQAFIDQQKGAVLDYLPKTALEPRELATPPKGFESYSNRWTLNINLNEPTTVEIPIFYFPGWKSNYAYSLSPTGRIMFNLPSGTHTINGKFTNTPIRTLANYLSLVGLLGLIFVYAKYSKLFK